MRSDPKKLTSISHESISNQEILDQKKVEFIDVSFQDCDFENSTIDNCLFKDCTFSDCDLSDCDFVKCDFENVNFEKQKREISNITFKDCLLISCEFTSWKFQDCDFNGFDLEKCVMMCCTFLSSNMLNSDWECLLRSCIIYNSILKDSNLSCRFDLTRLESVQFYNVDFRNSDFSQHNGLDRLAVEDCLNVPKELIEFSNNASKERKKVKTQSPFEKHYEDSLVGKVVVAKRRSSDISPGDILKVVEDKGSDEVTVRIMHSRTATKGQRQVFRDDLKISPIQNPSSRIQNPIYPGDPLEARKDASVAILLEGGKHGDWIKTTIRITKGDVLEYMGSRKRGDRKYYRFGLVKINEDGEPEDIIYFDVYFVENFLKRIGYEK